MADGGQAWQQRLLGGSLSTVEFVDYGTTSTDSTGVATLVLKRAARTTWRSIDGTFAGDDYHRPSTASG